MQTRNSKEISKYKSLSNQFLIKAKELFDSVGEISFNEQKEKWHQKYVSIPIEEKEIINRLVRLKLNNEWQQFKEKYDLLPKKYIDQAIALAIAALNKTIEGNHPGYYLKFANKEYFAEGSIKMGDHLVAAAPFNEKNKQKMLDAAKLAYKEALLKYHDIRGYYHFLSSFSDSDIDKAMITEYQTLKRMHDELDTCLLNFALETESY